MSMFPLRFKTPREFLDEIINWMVSETCFTMSLGRTLLFFLPHGVSVAHIIFFIRVRYGGIFISVSI